MAFFWLVVCETNEKIQKGPSKKQKDKRSSGESSAMEAKVRRGLNFIYFKTFKGNRQRLKLDIVILSTYEA
jgi:hypothetical protein